MLLEKYDPISIFNVPTFNQHFSMIISDEVQLLVTKYSVGFLQFSLHILRFMWTWLSCNRLLLTDCLVNPKKIFRPHFKWSFRSSNSSICHTRMHRTKLILFDPFRLRVTCSRLLLKVSIFCCPVKESDPI